MKIKKVRNVKTPTRGTERSAGLDFYVPDDFGQMILQHGASVCIPSGIQAEIPPGYMFLALEKSGCAIRGVTVGAKVVDEDYQGEIHLHVYNHSVDPVFINGGEKILQMILVPVLIDEVTVVPELHVVKTDRGTGGFGSTGLL
jgi:dUTP pyrophosphatase